MPKKNYLKNFLTGDFSSNILLIIITGVNPATIIMETWTKDQKLIRSKLCSAMDRSRNSCALICSCKCLDFFIPIIKKHKIWWKILYSNDVEHHIIITLTSANHWLLEFGKTLTFFVYCFQILTWALLLGKYIIN